LRLFLLIVVSLCCGSAATPRASPHSLTRSFFQLHAGATRLHQDVIGFPENFISLDKQPRRVVDAGIELRNNRHVIAGSDFPHLGERENAFRA
jgi:hypothetical protein